MNKKPFKGPPPPPDNKAFDSRPGYRYITFSCQNSASVRHIRVIARQGASWRSATNKGPGTVERGHLPALNLSWRTNAFAISLATLTDLSQSIPLGSPGTTAPSTHSHRR